MTVLLQSAEKLVAENNENTEIHVTDKKLRKLTPQKNEYFCKARILSSQVISSKHFLFDIP
jgi:hypothetical protein